MRRVLVCIFVCAAACGTPTPSNNNATNGGDTGGGDNNVTDMSTASNQTSNTTPNNGGNCSEIGERFQEAVRALPRDCAIDAGCQIAPRANVCDCDLAVSASADLTDYNAIRAELDGEACGNPFGCATGECPYRKLSEPGEIYATCNDENECEIVQILPCSEFEANASGGIVPPGGCMDNAGCTIRADLNPCGCGEAVSVNFPALAVQPIAEMIEINEARCNLQCMGCNSPGGAVCGDDGMGNMICMTQ